MAGQVETKNSSRNKTVNNLLSSPVDFVHVLLREKFRRASSKNKTNILEEWKGLTVFNIKFSCHKLLPPVCCLKLL